MSKVIEVENLSKAYRLGQLNTGTLSQDIKRRWALIRGKEDPFLRIGETNNRTVKGESNIVWSLKDINFSVEGGSAIGIIGRNGAGKSTLLKILSQITGPTTGSVKIRGRIASLLEVGTGFHPELSGRENVFLNGAILGMRKKEIIRKFDEIVDFSGVERYIDTPVKRYSSGMYVRLAFAVAAHLESEILIIDEVLAVGDAEFQKKCLGKMGDISKGQGRTVLFVSHNMAAVRELCNTSLLLHNGQISYAGSITGAINEYMAEPVKISGETDFLKDEKTRRGNGEVRFTKVSVNNGELSSDPSEETRIQISAAVLQDITALHFTYAIFGPIDTQPVSMGTLMPVSDTPLAKGSEVNFEFVIPKNTFRTGLFPLYLWLGKKGAMASENYHYDCIDRLFNLNFASRKSRHELGYDPMEPNALININAQIANKIIK